MKTELRFVRFSLALFSSALALIAVCAIPAAHGAVTKSIALGGTSSPQTGSFTPSGTSDATNVEFSGELDDDAAGPGPYSGIITNRSLSKGVGKGSSANSSKKAKSNPVFDTGFDGLNLYQQRYARGGNQFTVEPPDQALCVGNGYVVEAVNDVLNIFNTSGQSVLPDNTSTNIVGRISEKRESCRRPQLVLRLYSCDQPHHRCPRPGPHGSQLSVRRGDAALLRCCPDARDPPERDAALSTIISTSRSARRSNPTWAGTSITSMSRMTGRIIRPAATPAPAWATTRTSEPTQTGFISRPTRTRGSATASTARRSTHSRRRSSPPAPPT